MDTKLDRYRSIIVNILKHYAEMPYTKPNTNPQDELEEQLIIDTQNDHYQI